MAGERRSRPISPASLPKRARSISPPPAPTASPTCSTAAARRGSCAIIDERTLGFADFKGNRQYITTGNLAENAKAFIFVMDYTQRRRVKIWGRARVVEGDAALLAKLWPEGYKARPEQVIVFDIEAWDTNCPQHIPQMFAAEDVGRTVRSSRPASASWKQRSPRSRAGPVSAGEDTD